MKTPRALTREHHESALELLVEAFHDNPAHVYIRPDASTRRERLTWLFGRNLSLQMSVGRSFARTAEEEPSRVEAMGFWHAPGTHAGGLATMLRHGLVWAPFRLGWDATRRLLETTEGVERQRLRDLGGRESWLLNNMIVRSSRRGSGLGSELLSGQLREVVEPSGHPASLATQRPENVRFYERLGFRVTSEATIGEGRHAFTNRIMLYER